METSYQVRIWKIESRKNARGKVTSHRVLWEVGGNRCNETYKLYAQADSFRSDLMSAMRRGEAFDTETGLPVSMKRQQATMDWFSFACSYVDMKWPDSSPKYRKSLAESMTRISVAMLRDGTDINNDRTLRGALMKAFSTAERRKGLPQDVANLLKAVEHASRNVADLAKPDVLRSVLGALDLNLDGKRASANTIRIRRTALGNALDFAVEPGNELLDTNPLSEIKVKKRNYILEEVDPAGVVNPMQGRMLIDAVGETSKQGAHLKAFFGLQYYAACRPEEAANVTKDDLLLPEPTIAPGTGENEFGWGDIRLRGARPEVGGEWTDSGQANEERSLKHRPDGFVRVAPCPPPLTKLLYEHLRTFGTAPDGRLFRNRKGGQINSSTYGSIWAKARAAVFTPEIVASPLAKRPYDLRHACVSTLLSAGVEATRVAKWAGHSVAVLLRVYAKCLDGGEKAARDRIARAQFGW